MIEDLTYDELCNLITRAQQCGILHSVKEVMIAEANIFLCDYQGMRINFKFDLDYGVFVEPVDAISSRDMEELRRTLEAI